MLSTSWAVPARVAGRDGFAMPARAALPAVPANAVPVAGAVARPRPVAVDADPGLRLQLKCTTPIAQNDGTTLGSHSPRRPRS
jgi:hypothetical protein